MSDPKPSVRERVAASKARLLPKGGSSTAPPNPVMSINRLIDNAVRCANCGAKMGGCNCWDTCKHGKRCESGCTICTLACSCGWFTAEGVPCGNPGTHACVSRVRWGKHNRKTRRYE